MMKNSKFVFSLCGCDAFKQTRHSDELALIKEETSEDTVILAFTDEVDEISYEQALLIILEKVENHPDKTFKSLILDLSRCLYWNWDILVKNLASRKETLSHVNCLKFNESSLSLKQLRELYWLFKDFQSNEVLFPEVSIDKTPAVSQLFENEKNSEIFVSNNFRRNSMRGDNRSKKRELREIMSGRVIDKDISKEEFMNMIEDEGNSGKMFLMKTHWNEKRSLYDDLTPMPY